MHVDILEILSLTPLISGMLISDNISSFFLTNMDTPMEYLLITMMCKKLHYSRSTQQGLFFKKLDL